MSIDGYASEIVRLIQSARMTLSTEKALQAELSDLLQRSGIAFEREKFLSARDIPDFMLENGLVIECKLHGANKRDTYRQLCRYADHAQVSGLILALGGTMGLPAELNGKPVFIARLSQGWL